MRRSIALTAAASLCLLLSACGNETSLPESVLSEVPTATFSETATYQQITQEEAEEMMHADDGHIIVDVRRQDEFDSGHIPGAILIPNESIGTECPKELPDLNQIIMIYCRSGRRSKEASQKLADMVVEKVIPLYGKRFEQMRDHPLDDCPEIIENKELMYMKGNTAHCMPTAAMESLSKPRVQTAPASHSSFRMQEQSLRQGKELLDTFGIYINKISDMEYREELLKVLIPMQHEVENAAFSEDEDMEETEDVDMTM